MLEQQQIKIYLLYCWIEGRKEFLIQL